MVYGVSWLLVVRIPSKSVGPKGKGQRLGVVTKRPVKQDTDVAPDIGRANYDDSYSFNADSR